MAINSNKHILNGISNISASIGFTVNQNYPLLDRWIHWCTIFNRYSCFTSDTTSRFLTPDKWIGSKTKYGNFIWEIA
ncbi:unnamed protein product [Rhizophagus irregularis]|nr:unnamed protein product [Rhizophagus irregularis]